MPSISLYQKLVSELGEKGLLQAAKAEGLAAKSISEIPETVLEKIKAKIPSPEPVMERGPSNADLDAIKPFEASLDLGAEKIERAAPGMSGMKKAMGAGGAGAALAAGYGASGSWGEPEKKPVGPVTDEGLEGGVVPGDIKSVKERVQDGMAPSSEMKVQAVPSISIPKVGARPADYSAGAFSYDDSQYQKTLEGLKNKEEAAKGKYEGRQNTSAWGEVAERIAQAAARYGAARQGLKSGVDLSNIQMDKTDWKSRREQSERDLEREQRGLGSERNLATDANRSTQAASERQFEREESAKKDTAGQKFREYEKQLSAAERARERSDDLKIQEAKDANRAAKEAAAAETKRKQEMEDFENKEKIKDKYSPAKESEESKRSAKKEEALSGLHAAYLSGDAKEISKQRLAATQYLTPQQSHAIEGATASLNNWWGSNKKAAAEIEKILTGQGQGATSSEKSPGLTSEDEANIKTYAEQYKLDPVQARNIYMKRKASGAK